ncbi:MAG TPA: sigma 54-interacting transcriptional regulator [Methylomirabilota bacterium]|nr:sigma 54-interacting transcriptional regulator [Methylomirabilota bacterium]
MNPSDSHHQHPNTAEGRAILDALPAIAWCKLPDGSNEFVNQRWQDYTGIPEDEARGLGWQAAVHPDDLPKLTEKWAEIVASGKGGEFEGRLRRRDGVFRWFLARFEPVRDNAGEIVRWYGTSTDIDALKQAEAKLREDERALRRITDAIPQTIVVQDPDGIPVYANQAVLDYTGLTMADILTSDFRSRIFHPADLKRVREQRQAALARGLPFEIEQRALRKDGQYRWFLIRYNPFRDEQGRLVSWYATGTDIDDRKRAEDRTRNENVALREEIVRSAMFEEIVGSSDALRTVANQIAKVAPSDSTVLIQGETGAGKELVARAIHNRSRRANRAFIRVNCAAIPQALIASELFGHEKGAFTGALQRRLGRFESADGGTIFLDEIGELPQETQVALLRVLQEREFERVGGNEPIVVDVRVLAATNRDLTAAVRDGVFRADLFYRLNVVPIQVPALRDRRGDIRLLVEYFVERYAQKAGKRIRSISKETLDLFEAYRWPGNIRELQNVIERAVILSDADVFRADPSWLTPAPAEGVVPTGSLTADLAQREKAIIEDALREAHGVIGGATGAAAKLGLPRQTLESRMRKLGIDRYRFKTL